MTAEPPATAIGTKRISMLKKREISKLIPLNARKPQPR
jgi:hypothetical protein